MVVAALLRLQVQAAAIKLTPLNHRKAVRFIRLATTLAVLQATQMLLLTRSRFKKALQKRMVGNSKINKNTLAVTARV